MQAICHMRYVIMFFSDLLLTTIVMTALLKTEAVVLCLTRLTDHQENSHLRC